jgi:hypothetical protein
VALAAAVYGVFLIQPGISELLIGGRAAALPGVGGSGLLADAAGRLPPPSSLEVLASLASALVLTLPLSWVYMATRARVGFDQSVAQTMVILPVAVAGIVVVVQDSLALAFSLAGIVAAVRFRTTLKRTSDALYIFACIAIGLASGVGAIDIAAIFSSFFCFVVLVLWRCDYATCPGAGPQAEYASGEFVGRAEVKALSEAKRAKRAKRAKIAAEAEEKAQRTG